MLIVDSGLVLLGMVIIGIAVVVPVLGWAKKKIDNVIDARKKPD